ncbi:hypothetical protein C2845_PM18G05520 [Panicum miliaceum]|uniref:Uncharacterized protein n=1 Tax=Panicum miliaceum TaxID=4540 RepID=A0A3L6PKG3_PANMI|nr:hypothetical protein C2845_PM18G05520 [Panicum miliaceum]
MAKAHILVLQLPAQGHVTLLMELSHRLVDHGFEVTFVNTEAHHARVIGVLQAAGGTAALVGIHLASISDEIGSLNLNSDTECIPTITNGGTLAAGWPERDETFQLAPGVLPLHTSQVLWVNARSAKGQPVIFELFSQTDRLTALAEMVVCNWGRRRQRERRGGGGPLPAAGWRDPACDGGGRPRE